MFVPSKTHYDYKNKHFNSVLKEMSLLRTRVLQVLMFCNKFNQFFINLFAKMYLPLSPGFYSTLLYITHYTMTLQRPRIIVQNAGFDPGTAVYKPQPITFHNQPPHLTMRHHISQMSHHISHWATTSHSEPLNTTMSH